jgi:hypothetical protein
MIPPPSLFPLYFFLIPSFPALLPHSLTSSLPHLFALFVSVYIVILFALSLPPSSLCLPTSDLERSVVSPLFLTYT